MIIVSFHQGSVTDRQQPIGKYAPSKWNDMDMITPYVLFFNRDVISCAHSPVKAPDRHPETKRNG